MREPEATEQSCRALVVLRNRNGLHARPAHLWVQTANAYASSVRVARPGDEPVDGKSIMGMMMLAAENGVALEIVATGPDCDAQVRALKELVESGFGED